MAAQDPIDRIPPQSIEAETAVLGSMLLDREAIAQAIELLDESYFYKDAHKKIYSAITKLYDNNKAIDIVTLTDALRKAGALDEAGGPAYITGLVSAVPTAANIIHYAKIVKEKMTLRSLITASTQIVGECYDTSQDVDTLVDKAEQMIFDISSKKIEKRIIPIKDVIKSSIETIDNLYQRKEHITGIGTGYRDLDIKTAGLQKSDLIVIAGRPSMGKSAFASCIAEHTGVIDKKPVAFFSLEMSKEQLVQRMLCSHARVDAHKVRTGFLSQADWPRLVTAAGKLSEAPIYIDDSPGITVMELRAKARRLKAQFDIQLIILDYLQLMQGRSTDNRVQEVSEISRSLKQLARELNIPVIALSQLNRSVESRSPQVPKLSDLRESGSIEQDADVVMFLYREDREKPDTPNKNVIQVIVAKHRNGPLGTANLYFNDAITSFSSLEKKHGGN